jgi:DNA-binding NarL/FixJ family response regulator
VPSIRIAVLSDDRLLCDGVIKILQADPAFDIVAHERTAAAGRLLRTVRADVWLIDSRLDGAFELCGQASGDAATLLIAAPEDSAWCRDALCAGASGALPKDAGAAELVNAVRVVHDGSVWAPRRVMADCIKHLLTTPAARRAGGAMLEQHLSRREREIFREAATGLGNKELAARLAIGEATVKAHLTRIFQKLGVRGRAELAAVYHGVLIPTRIVHQRSTTVVSGHAKK